MNGRPGHSMRLVAAIVAVACAAVAAVGQTSITLRTRAIVEPGQPVLLGDVALLRGDAAEALGGIEILEATRHRRAARVDVGDVRRVLSAQEGFDWGVVTIRGSSCRLLGSGEREAERTTQSTARDDDAEPMRVASEIATGTVRGRIAAMLAAYLGVQASDLRVGFRAQDRELLDTRIGGYTAEIRPLAVASRITVRVALIDAGDARIGVQGVARVRVEVRREIVETVRRIRRGAVIGPEDVTTTRRWIDPEIRAATAAEVIGSAAVSPIESGRVVRRSDVREPMAVRKGDLLTVRCVSGTVILRSQGRAMANARRGEVIELESLHTNRKERRRFRVRITGPGQAVTISRATDP